MDYDIWVVHANTYKEAREKFSNIYPDVNDYTVLDATTKDFGFFG